MTYAPLMLVLAGAAVFVLVLWLARRAQAEDEGMPAPGLGAFLKSLVKDDQ